MRKCFHCEGHETCGTGCALERNRTFCDARCFYGTFTFIGDSSVSIVTALQAGRLSNGNSVAGKFSTAFRPAVGPTKPSYPLGKVKGKVVAVLN
jgi:hypothetical protein